MIDKNNVIKIYSKFIECGVNSLNDNQINKCLSCCKAAAQYMYNYNAIYSDDNIENTILEACRRIIPHPQNYEHINEGPLLFYSYAPQNGRGLAHIYLDALVAMGMPFYWLTFKSYNTLYENDLIRCIENSNNGVFKEIDDTKSPVSLVEQIDAFINEIKPNKALLIPAPWDAEIIGYLGICKDIQTIYVNGTDHTFWLGKNIFDKILEFRNFGYSVTKNSRHIPVERIDRLPYYPWPAKKKFKGLSFLNAGDKLISSGGSLYKIYGSTLFFEIVKRILDTYPKVKFVYIGNGNPDRLLSFIKNNGYNDRLFYLQEREDFEEIIKLSFFYLNTYPIIGGLMSQYAVANDTIPLGICESWDKCNDVDELFIENGNRFIFESKEKLFQEIDKLFLDEQYYEERKASLKKILFTREMFIEGLKKVMQGIKTGYELKEEKIDLDRFTNQYYIRGSLINDLFFCGKTFLKYKFPFIVKKMKQVRKFKSL